MARHIDDYDYFVNIEDDILLPETTLANVVEFDQESLLNEILHPNRIEEDEAGRRFCVDLEAMPGWTYQRRTYRGRELRVARNPHSAVLILSRAKLRYAQQYIDPAYRGRFLTYEMDSALAYYLSPFCLYRPYDDLSFHTVGHLDRWAGSRAPRRRQAEAVEAAATAIALEIGRQGDHPAGPAQAPAAEALRRDGFGRAECRTTARGDFGDTCPPGLPCRQEPFARRRQEDVIEQMGTTNPGIRP